MAADLFTYVIATQLRVKRMGFPMHGNTAFSFVPYFFAKEDPDPSSAKLLVPLQFLTDHDMV